MDQDKIIAKYLPYLKEIQQKLLHVILVFLLPAPSASFITKNYRFNHAYF